MTLFAVVDVNEYIAQCRVAQLAATTQARKWEIGRCIDWAVGRRIDLRLLVMTECGALARIAVRGRRQALLSQEIAFYRWADAEFGNPGALTLRHYRFIRGFVHG